MAGTEGKSMGKRVAVIGAGASGLTAIKCCLDEGLEPVCFERTDDIGGLWNYKDGEVADGQACVMRSTVINTSKEMMAYSDFPIPDSFPVFMHNTYVQKYFRLYASNFGLERHIRFQTEVIAVQPASDFAQTGQWEVHSRDLGSKEEKLEILDGVLICTGHHAQKLDPDFPGLSSFKGQVTHTHDYRTPDGMKDKRVLIIGLGNSGGDAAVELSRWASQVFLSTRRGAWILTRLGRNGIPADMVGIRRFLWKLLELMPKSLLYKGLEKHLNERINHDLYSLRPNSSPFAQHPLVSDDLPNRIICGTIKVKGDVERFTETGVSFVDGTTEEEIDVVLKATGYTFDFPFLDTNTLEVKDNRVPLYKYMYPPDLAHPTLAIIGCVQPLGSIIPLSEMQCRLATRVIKKDVMLPTKSEMWADVRSKEADMAKRYVGSRRHTIQVDYIPYMDELAQLVGCKPKIGELFLSDLTLAMQVLFGPTTPYQFRLQGPGQWSGARDAILTQWDRVRVPLKTRQVSVKSNGESYEWLIKFGVIIMLLVLLRYLFW